MIFLDNSYLKEFESNIVNINKNQIILNQTIFYAKSGGQPGDIGTLSDKENNINIIDTIYDLETHEYSNTPGSVVLETWGWVNIENDYEFHYNNYLFFLANSIAIQFVALVFVTFLRSNPCIRFHTV